MSNRPERRIAGFFYGLFMDDDVLRRSGVGWLLDQWPIASDRVP